MNNQSRGKQNAFLVDRLVRGFFLSVAIFHRQGNGPEIHFQIEFVVAGFFSNGTHALLRLKT